MAGNNVSPLQVPAPPGKRDMLEMLDQLRNDVERGEIIGLMVTVINANRAFANYSAADVPASSRIGYLMCHVADLTASMQ